jgi:hypothetical protein
MSEEYGPSRVSYLVINENTLGYVTASYPSVFGVLAGSVLRGGHNPFNGPVYISPWDHVRPADIGDFESYRVDARGHLDNQNPLFNSKSYS